MPPTALVLAPVLLAAVLVVAAAGKLRAPAHSADALVALDVPRWLRAPRLVKAHPWAELALAVALVLATGWLGTAVAVAAALLFAGYLVLIARAATQPEPVDCDCFGALGAGPVTRRTVVRNVWYLVVAGLAIWAHAGGVGPASAVVGLDAAGWWWFAGAAAAAVTVAVTMHGQGSARPDAEAAGDEEDVADYIRVRTPAVPVSLPDGGTRTLRELSRERAQLILLVSETCGFCEVVAKQVPAWRKELELIDLRLLVPTEPGKTTMTEALNDPMTLHDPAQLVRETFSVRGMPSAVLLGIDGLVAGGPVSGTVAIEEFVQEIRNQLDEVHEED